MKICAISDTHGYNSRITLPESDLIIHAGDLTMSGTVKECRDALGWLNDQPSKVVIVAGNHDFAFESEHKHSLILGFDNITYLENSGTKIIGIKIWGSPVTPWFFNWAFNVQRGNDIKKYWDLIPEDTDVLITHGPPFGILDQSQLGRSPNLGCEELIKKVSEISPKVHVFGHIHGSYGIKDLDDTKYINASLLNEAYEQTNSPIIIDV